MSQRGYLGSKSKSRQGGCPGWGRRCREFEWRHESFLKGRWNSEKRLSFSNVIKAQCWEEQTIMLFLTIDKGHVCTHDGVWWLRNALCVAPPAPLPTRHVCRQGRANSLFAEASSTRAWGACVEHSEPNARRSDISIYRRQFNSALGLSWWAIRLDPTCMYWFLFRITPCA